MKKSAVTDEHKKALHRNDQKNYLKKRDAKIAAGDKKAIEQKARDYRNKRLSTAKNFIKKDATLKEISFFRDLLANRVLELKNKKDKKE